MVSRAIKSAQTQVEQQNFEIRKNVLKYDEVMNQQRKVIYAERRLHPRGRERAGAGQADGRRRRSPPTSTAPPPRATSRTGTSSSSGTALKMLYPVGIDHHDLIDSGAVGEPGELTRDELLRRADRGRTSGPTRRGRPSLTEIGGEGAMRQLERSVLLDHIDRKWREHLYEMDYLKEGIGLRAMAQRDPLVEYQREGYDMFIGMLDGLKEESVGLLFNAQVQAAPAPPSQVGADGRAAEPGAVRRRRRGQGAGSCGGRSRRRGGHRGTPARQAPALARQGNRRR